MDAPPSYDTAVSSTTTKQSTSDPSVPHKTRNGIPPQSRRSMEDESRPLPDGWIRQFDPQSGHQFFVDTTVTPPRSTWHHPNDDEEYLSSLPPDQRDHIHTLLRVPTQADMMAESSDDDEHHGHGHGHAKGEAAAGGTSQQQSHFPTELPRRPSPPPKGIHKLGRNLKDKLTSSTHSEREIARAKRAEEERKTYARHKLYREAMARAIETGEPQLLGKDSQGKDVYIEPPVGYGAGGYGAGGYGGYGGGYGYNPYAQGPYASPNARFMRPQTDYYRPYGYGYGGGLGLPLGLGLGAGLLGGSLLF